MNDHPTELPPHAAGMLWGQQAPGLPIGGTLVSSPQAHQCHVGTTGHGKTAAGWTWLTRWAEAAAPPDRSTSEVAHD